MSENLKDEFGTPWFIFNAMHKLFKFELDVCASAENHKLPQYCTKEVNGLIHPWANSNWCNPPYSKPLPWVDKAVEDDSFTAMLLKTDVSTKFYKRIWESSAVIWHINHRIKYVGASQSAEFSSMIALFHTGLLEEKYQWMVEKVSLVKFTDDERIIFL